MTICDTNVMNLSKEWRIVLGVTNTAIGIAAFLGNLVAFIVIFKTKYFRNFTTCFLCSLIMTDFLVGVLLEPMYVAQLFSQEIQNSCTFNDARRYFSSFLIGASIISIVLISYDRYIHLSRTQNYDQYMNKRKVSASILVGWVVTATGPTLTQLGKDERFYSGILFVFVCVCFIIITSSYIAVLKIVRKKINDMAKSQSQNKEQRRRAKYDVQAAKAVVTLIICFAITIMPISVYHCTVAVKNFLRKGIPGFKETSREIWYAVGMALAMANSGINPLIYYLRNPKFKKSLIKVIQNHGQ